MYRKIGRISEREFKDILDNNRIKNCPLTYDDAKRALQIYGPDERVLQGKTRKKKSKHVISFDAIPIPSDIANDHGDVTLCADIFYVNKEKYFHTISRNIKFRTIAPIKTRKKDVLLRETKAIKKLYEARGFKICDLHVDNELACIREDIRPTNLNVANADDHVPEVERSIQTVKDRVRCLWHGLPYKKVPKLLSRSMVENAVKNLNDFPAKDGVSTTISPKTIVTGAPVPDYNDMKLEFGTYAHVYKDHKIKNDNKARTTPSIALNRTGNGQGGYYFMSLVTGKKLSRKQWDLVPMLDEAIATVEAMATKQNQPIMVDGPIFEWAPGRPIDDMPAEVVPDDLDNDDDDDEILIARVDPEPEAEEADTSDAADEDKVEDSGDDSDITSTSYEPSTDEDSNQDISYDPSTDGDDMKNNITEEIYDDTDNTIKVEDVEIDDVFEETHDDAIDMFEESENIHNDESRSENNDDHDTEQRSEHDSSEDDQNSDEPTGRYNLRGARDRSYSHRFEYTMDNPANTKKLRLSIVTGSHGQSHE